MFDDFGCADPDEAKFVVLFVHTPFLHVVIIHFPLVQECDVEECEELDNAFRRSGFPSDDIECKKDFPELTSDFGYTVPDADELLV